MKTVDAASCKKIYANFHERNISCINVAMRAFRITMPHFWGRGIQLTCDTVRLSTSRPTKKWVALGREMSNVREFCRRKSGSNWFPSKNLHWCSYCAAIGYIKCEVMEEPISKLTVLLMTCVQWEVQETTVDGVTVAYYGPHAGYHPRSVPEAGARRSEKPIPLRLVSIEDWYWHA